MYEEIYRCELTFENYIGQNLESDFIKIHKIWPYDPKEKSLMVQFTTNTTIKNIWKTFLEAGARSAKFYEWDPLDEHPGQEYFFS